MVFRKKSTVFSFKKKNLARFLMSFFVFKMAKSGLDLHCAIRLIRFLMNAAPITLPVLS
jgi:hypothetical protein